MSINLDVLKFRVWDTMRDCFFPNEHGKLIWSLEEAILGDADKDFSTEKMIV